MEGVTNMSDSRDDDTHDVFTRTRAQFGSDAEAALLGVRSILRSLCAGYERLDRQPPLNTFREAEKAVDKLIDFTKSVYIKE